MITHIFIPLACSYLHKIFFFFSTLTFTYDIKQDVLVMIPHAEIAGYQDAAEFCTKRMSIKQKLMQELMRPCAIAFRGKICFC